ncbi:unnamed protein product [Mytilus coruscus]|uniref:SWIM-type domain-containing protein n=1 Tax=Mytilus coruscus TaxID=42192 RepID=A0A6J8E5L5_MYTCO|nr:unnamed protein product [Mytilus coruscus]
MYLETRIRDLEAVNLSTSEGPVDAFDMVCVFSGDGPARQFEAGQQRGGNDLCICGARAADHGNLVSCYLLKSRRRDVFGDLRRVSESTTNRQAGHIVNNAIMRITTQQQLTYKQNSFTIQDSCIGKKARLLPPRPSNFFLSQLIANRSVLVTSHLKRIADFMICGKGVWWMMEDGNIVFFDGPDDPQFHREGPTLHHFRSSSLKKEQIFLSNTWQLILEMFENGALELPLNKIKVFDDDDDVTEEISIREEIATTKRCERLTQQKDLTKKISRMVYTSYYLLRMVRKDVIEEIYMCMEIATTERCEKETVENVTIINNIIKTRNTRAFGELCSKMYHRLMDMPPQSNYFKCVLCSKCTKPKERATVNKNITNHICDGHLNDDALCRVKTTGESFVNRTYLLEIMNKMRKKIRESASRRLYFDDSNLSEPDYITMTRLSKINFSEVCSTLSKYLKNTPARTITTNVAIFLGKLKSGMSNRFLSTIFCVSKSSVRRAFNSVRQAFMSEFVPANLGFQHISREEVIQKHTRPLAQSMFGGITSNNAILVLDGTYIYVDKSNNFHFQRRSYTTHKDRPLVKPMIVCTTTGYYVSVFRPYLADYRNNDASILTHMLKTNVEEIRDWVNEEDIFVLDRGFRDAIPILEDLGIQAEMPRFLKKGDKQFSTEDANMPRLVTKYDPPLSQCTDVESDQLEAAKMIHLSKMSNTLKEHVETENQLKKKLIWKIASECDLENFPRLDDQELRNITRGVYQMKHASSYIQEYTDEESDIFVHREDSNLLRIKIQSRHTSLKKHRLWIRYNELYIDSWYCLCRAGSRVVGACSHVAAVL